jgi:adenylate kinase
VTAELWLSISRAPEHSRRFEATAIGLRASNMPELNLILLGPPGAGKGTQAERLVVDFDLPYYATGDILRAAVKEETELGKKAREFMDRGDLVPDELICEVIMERIDSPEAADGFILDGFPRTLGQADVLERGLEQLGRRITAALLLDASDDEVVRRLSGRRICVKNGHLYHVDFDPPKREDVCDQDGSRLIQRDDDKPETIKRRLEVYHKETSPLVGHYDEQGILRRFDAARPPGEVHDHIRATLATLRLEDEL